MQEIDVSKIDPETIQYAPLHIGQGVRWNGELINGEFARHDSISWMLHDDGRIAVMFDPETCDFGLFRPDQIKLAEKQ